jgi:hypothetical protein
MAEQGTSAVEKGQAEIEALFGRFRVIAAELALEASVCDEVNPDQAERIRRIVGRIRFLAS